jgi:hypothetical protein
MLPPLLKAPILYITFLTGKKIVGFVIFMAQMLLLRKNDAKEIEI